MTGDPASPEPAEAGAAPGSPTSSGRRRTVPLPLVLGYVVSVTAAAVLLAVVGDWVLAGGLLIVEVVVSAMVAWAVRRPPRAVRPPGSPRLGTPYDPGNSSGRR